MTATNPAQSHAKRKLVIKRAFAAPAERVFDAWLDPVAARRWLFATPEGQMVRCDIDARVGGGFTITERRKMPAQPQELDVAHVGKYREIARPRRLVFEFSVPQFSKESTVVTVEIAAHGPSCELTLTHEGVLPEWAEKTREGWTMLLGGLAASLGGTEAFRLSRTFAAPRELVWKAWSDRNELMQWFGPKGCTMPTAQMDFRPGGRLLYSMRTPDGKEMWGKWIFQEIVPPERIVLVHSFSDANGGITRHPFHPTWPLEMLSSTTFTEEDGRTTVTVQWEPLNATEVEAKTFEEGRGGMNFGWKGTFEQLDAYLANRQK